MTHVRQHLVVALGGFLPVMLCWPSILMESVLRNLCITIGPWHCWFYNVMDLPWYGCCMSIIFMLCLCWATPDIVVQEWWGFGLESTHFLVNLTKHCSHAFWHSYDGRCLSEGNIMMGVGLSYKGVTVKESEISCWLVSPAQRALKKICTSARSWLKTCHQAHAQNGRLIFWI